MEGYGCTFVSCELDEMYIESEYLVYQIGIEDGAVFAVILRIVETFLEVEILLAMELLIICSVWESLLYESQDAVGCFLFAEILYLCSDLLHHIVAQTLIYYRCGYGRNIYDRIFIEQRHDAGRYFALQGDARSFVSERLSFIANHGLAGESQSHVLAQLCALRQFAGTEGSFILYVRIDVVALAVDVEVRLFEYVLHVRDEHHHMVAAQGKAYVVAAVGKHILRSDDLLILAGVWHGGIDVFLYEHGRTPVAESHLA